MSPLHTALRVRETTSYAPMKRDWKKKIHLGLWEITNNISYTRRSSTHKSSPRRQENFVTEITPSSFPHFWYESRDGYLGVVYHIHSPVTPRNTPVVLLLGPLVHPTIAIQSDNAVVNSLLQSGSDVFIISHRNHTPSSYSHLDHSFDGIVREDIPCAIREIRKHSSSDKFHWIASDLGGILALLWIAQSGFSAIEKLSLINTPCLFHPNPSPHIFDILFGQKWRIWKNVFHHIPDQHTIQNFMQWELCTDILQLEFSQQERSLLYHSNCPIHTQLVEQWCLCIQKGIVCDASGGINILEALPKHENFPEIHVYSSDAKFIGGHQNCYPLIHKLGGQWHELPTTDQFPLYTTAFHIL